MIKRIVLSLSVLLVLTLLGLGGAAYWAHQQAAASLPQLDGDLAVPGLTAPVTIERDALGIPTLRAENRRDLALATGYVHGQDRFFQMDLLRRNSAGELAELFGRKYVSHDRRIRVHRFRSRAQKVVSAASTEERDLLAAYAEGVNAAVADLAKPPVEYLLLGATPAPWKPEDSVLCLYSMYLDLQGGDYLDESTLGVLHDTLPAPLAEFLAPQGTAEWDAPVEGWPLTVPPMPGPDVYDVRADKSAPKAARAHRTEKVLGGMRPGELEPCFAGARGGTVEESSGFHPGSNGWAVAGDHTAHGGAIVANDMHLDIRVPNTWYRARFVWPRDDGEENVITGATLPGTPAMVVGSNEHIAWGFTNSQGDWSDLVVLDVDPNDERVYYTPDGPRQMDRITEVVRTLEGDEESLGVYETIWGPVIDKDHQGRSRALRWVAHDIEGVNMGLLRMEEAHALDDALALAAECGSPAQNFVVADREGQIGWTILGRIPRRVGWDGRLPGSWTDGSRRWDGYLSADEYPRITEPADGRIWTANARVVSDDKAAKLGAGLYDLGARAKQIRDDLLALDNANEQDMLDVQLDDRAVFLERWQTLLVDTLSDKAVEGDARRAEMCQLVKDWRGAATIDSAGYRLVREFRRQVAAAALEGITRPCKLADDRFDLGGIDMSEGAVWALVTERPMHLLDPQYSSWDELLLGAVDATLATSNEDDGPLAEQTWGRANTARIEHPLFAEAAPPWLSRWLELAMPPDQLAGDSENMPRIQGPRVGASQRMAVSPGREAEGYFHMPCGQSGHPLSPHYADGHAAWVEGKATPFLPGKPVHKLVLRPGPT